MFSISGAVLSFSASGVIEVKSIEVRGPLAPRVVTHSPAHDKR